MIEKSFLWATFGLGLIIAGTVVWVIWTMFAPLTLFDAPPVWRVKESRVHPGDEVFVNLKFCKSSNLPAEIGRMTIGRVPSGEEYFFTHPTVTGSIPKGCYTKLLSVATMPLNAKPGKYRVSISIRIHYSAFRVVQQHFLTEEFDVLAQ